MSLIREYIGEKSYILLKINYIKSEVIRPDHKEKKNKLYIASQHKKIFQIFSYNYLYCHG